MELIHPQFYGVDQIIAYVPVAQIQLDQVVIAVPALIPEVVAAGTLTAEVQTGKPVAVFRCLSLFLDILECPEVASHVVEYAVQDDPDAVFVQFVADVGKHFVGAQPAVNHPVVGGIIAVFHRLEHRSEVDCINAQFFQMRNPVQHLFQPVHRFAAFVVLRCTAESQGIDVIHYRIFIPFHFSFLLLLLYHKQGESPVGLQLRQTCFKANLLHRPFQIIRCLHIRHIDRQRQREHLQCSAHAVFVLVSASSRVSRIKLWIMYTDFSPCP